MPELPEVETLRQDLRKTVLGRTIVDAWVAPGAERIIPDSPPDEFCRRLRGARIGEVLRRGKFLIFQLDAEHGFLLVHRRMSGNFLLRPQGAPPDPYTRVVFTLDDGRELRYTDLRKFGLLRLVADPAPLTQDLGPEPLDDGFTPEVLAERLRGRRMPVKALLLDQRAVAGLGNLYSDEALAAAGIHPLRPAADLTLEEVRRLWHGVRAALAMGLRNRGSSLGTSLRDHINLDGSPGENMDHVRVFQRTGQPCPTCGTPIARTKVAGRSSHYCPRCQPLV
jgi:formamidopyrimidine-DNA glycosylase